MKISKKPKSGNVLLDFIGGALMTGSLMIGVFLVSFLSMAQQLQKTEIYFLARSRLYGNTKDCSTRPSLWPELKGLEISYECDEGARVDSRLRFRGKEIFHQYTELERN